MTPADGGRGTEPARPAPGRPIGRRRRLRRRTITVLAVLALVGGGGGAIAWWTSRPTLYRPGEDIPEITRRLARELPEGAPEVRLADVTAETGLAGFATFAGARSSQLPEDMGSGAAWGDFDRDGDDDLFLVSNGGSLEAAPETWAPCRLYENRDGSFVPSDAFPALRILGMGAAWGDCDGDGWLDLVVSGHDALRLYRNREGTLVRDETFPDPPGFWAGVSWGDYDGDRDLDLYVCGYVRYELVDADRAKASRQFGTAVPFTLNPSSYEPERNLLLRNDGAGAFRDVADELGVANPEGRSLGALWHDVDEDGRLDLYVANDISDNVLFRNLGDRFADVSHPAVVADYRGAMGLALGDYDRDGDDDIFVTHWVAQENALYASLLVDFAERAADGGDGPGPPPRDDARPAEAPPALRYLDVAAMSGLGQIALQKIGWGAEFADLDADGWLDLVVANGSTFETDDDPKGLKPQESFLFWNRDGRTFHDLAPTCDVLAGAWVSHGLAVSDYDRDGDLDLLFVDHGAGVRLLRNDMPQGRSIQVRLRSLGAGGRPTGSGENATIVVEAGGATHRRTATGPSYLSQSTRTLHVGLGDAPRVDRLEVRWHGGGVDVFEDLDAGAVWELTEGDAEPRRVGPAPAAGADPPDDATSALSERERVRLFWEKHRAGMRAVKVDEDHEAAVPLFREALALDPSHEDARYYLANSLATLGDTAGARRELETLVEISPRSHRALKRLGILRATDAADRADLEAALALLERALAVNREETGVLLAMSEVELMTGARDEARRRLELVCRTNPRAVSGWYLRGYVAWKQGDETQARSLLASAVEARGEEWTPEGTTSEGDVARRMHTEDSPLAVFWRTWDGTTDPAVAFTALDAHLAKQPGAAP